VRVVTREVHQSRLTAWLPASTAAAAMPLRVDDTTRRAARIERLGLTVTSAVLLFGLWLTYSERRIAIPQIRADVSAGRIVNLADVSSASQIVPLLGMFREPAERAAVAAAIFQRAHDPAQPLQHVGALAGITIPAARVRADARLVVLNERLRARGGDAVQALTAADIAAIKPSLIVRSPDAHQRRMLTALVLFMAAFWIAALARGWVGTTGDPLLLPIVHLLTGLGLMTMVALRDPLRDTLAASTMAEGIAMACLVWVALSVVDFEMPRLRRAVFAPLALACGLALALLVAGGGPAGSDAKVNLFGLQPVEIIRPLFVFSLAAYFARRWQHLRELSEPIAPAASGGHLRLPRWRDVRPLAISLGTLVMFSFLQKDLGPALVLSCVFLGLFGLARARGGLIATGGVAVVLAVWVGYLLGVPATVTRRVAIWLDPWNNALQGGDQVAHGLWALSTGGLSGLGTGVGDPQVIPAGHTDLVLAALGEELGFIGVAAVLALLALLVWRMLRTALRAPGDYTAFLVFGLTLALAVQALIIIGGTLGLMPLTGVVTPFLSYGRSSMLSNIAAVAVCAAIARRRGPVRVALVRPARAVGVTLALLVTIVIGRAALVQVVYADETAARANLTQQADGGYRYQYNPRLVAAGRAIRRGTIYDRSGLPVATSRPDEVQKFAAAYRALRLPLPDHCTDGRARCYPLGGLAFHVLGDAERQTNWAARNTSFAEKDFDVRLQGFDDRPQTIEITQPRTGRVHSVVRRDYRELLPLVRHQREPDHPDVKRILSRDRDVHLTLDARLQVAVARALEARTESARAEAGAAVVLDPASGGLLAAASYPWPMPEQASRGGAVDPIPQQQLLDRARYGLYPPGSTFKLVTAVAALRTSQDDQDSEFICTRLPDGRVGGRVRGASRPIRDDPADHQPHGKVDLHRALVVSCNPFFAQLAQRVGAKALDETASAAQIAAAPRPVLDHLPATLTHAGYGQGDVVASPMRMAGVAAALAGDGVLRPVVSVSPSDAAREPGTRWLPAAGAAQMRRYMRDVVTEGTGRVLAGHRVAIAGKTGTAEVDGKPSHSWFVGFAPYAGSGQRIAFATIVEHAGYGARTAAPLAGDIVNSAAELGLIR
jgi:cell division protein FtsW (lipid II flippase)/cell division protein FtsI/penicillin-binding protein 2